MSLPPNRIRELREAKGLSLRELARRIDADPTGLRLIELNQKNLTHEWMRRIAEGLEVLSADLLPEEDVGWQVSQDEARVLTLWRELDPANRAKIIGVMEIFADDGPETDSETLPHAAHAFAIG